MPGEDRHARCADLVRRVSICRYPVAPDEHCMNPAAAHHGGSHVVADDGHVDPRGIQLPRGKARALQPRPGLIRENLEPVAPLRAEVHGCGGGPVTGRRQRAGVAVGEQAPAGLQEGEAVLSDPATDLLVF